MRRALARALANPTTTAGAVITLLIVAAAVLAPLVAPYDPTEQDIMARLQGPSAEFLLGTDQFGRDVLSRLLWGARISLTVVARRHRHRRDCHRWRRSAWSAAISAGWFDLVTMQAMDVLLSFPSA